MNNLLTASRMDALLSCARKHYWSYEVGLKPVVAHQALRFGAAWHSAMEGRWHGFEYQDVLTKSSEGLEEIDIATLGGLLAGYFAKYREAEIVKSLHAETEFEHSLAGSRTFSVAGKIDNLGVLTDERQALVESKTTGDSIEPGSDYWLRLRFNSQVFQYVLAARHLGWQIEVVIYDVVRKPAIEPKQLPLLDDLGRKIVLNREGVRVLKANGMPRESGDKDQGYTLQTRLEAPEEFGQRLAEDTIARPDFYFARREVPILDQDLEAFQVQRLSLAKLILHYRNSQKRVTKPEDAWPRNISTWNCNGCAFKNFCLQNISVNLRQPPAGFTVGEFNPELTKEATAEAA